MAEFADVAGPVVGFEDGEGVVFDADEGFLVGAGEFVEAVERDEGDVAEAFAERGEGDGDDVEAVVEVGAESAGADFFEGVAVGGADDADVGGDVFVAADASEDAFLDEPEELGLEFEGHFADFVEEEGTAHGFFDGAGAAAVCAGEGAFFVAEEGGFDEFFGEGGHVEGDEGFGGAAGAAVDGAGDEFFAGAGFAGDHDGDVGGGDVLDGAEGGAHEG